MKAAAHPPDVYYGKQKRGVQTRASSILLNAKLKLRSRTVLDANPMRLVPD
jgi:hypothetical protein